MIKIIGIILAGLLFVGIGLALTDPLGHIEPTREGAKQLAECQKDYCIEKGLESSEKNEFSGFGWDTDIYCIGENEEEIKYDFDTEIYDLCDIEVRVTTIGKLIGVKK